MTNGEKRTYDRKRDAENALQDAKNEKFLIDAILDALDGTVEYRGMLEPNATKCALDALQSVSRLYIGDLANQI